MAIFLGLARAGDTVLTEQSTWPGALAVGQLSGIRLMPVAMDEEGLIPEEFEAAVRAHQPRFLYTMPTLHNPTTATAGLARRQDIVRIARAHDIIIVEDDAYGFLVEPRVPTYCQLARDITVYLTSLSKSIAPALRVGFMTIPPRLHRQMRAAVRATITMVSPILLELSTTMINSGAAAEAASAQVSFARERQALAASILNSKPPAHPSLHHWLKLPLEIHGATFAADALPKRRCRDAGRGLCREAGPGSRRGSSVPLHRTGCEPCREGVAHSRQIARGGSGGRHAGHLDDEVRGKHRSQREIGLVHDHRFAAQPHPAVIEFDIRNDPLDPTVDAR